MLKYTYDMAHLIDFTMPSAPLLPEFMKDKSSLKLMLWAGDGEHNGVSDVERLSNYDVFLCGPWNESGLVKNEAYLKSAGLPKIICVLDVKDIVAMNRFYDLFAGKFLVMNADYHGNTPILDLQHYHVLLSPLGKAYNIEGINSCIRPWRNFYKFFQLFAPFTRQLEYPLNTQIYDITTYSPFVRYWAKISDLSPSHLMSSPDFKGVQHQWAIDLKVQLDKHQNDFIYERNLENSEAKNGRAWFIYDKTIEEWWNTVPLDILTVDISSDSVAYKASAEVEDDVSTEFIQQYKPAFLEFLHSKIHSLLEEFPRLTINMEEVAKRLESVSIDSQVQTLQLVIKEIIIFKNQISASNILRGHIGPYMDDRHSNGLEAFKLHVIHSSGPYPYHG